MCRIWRECRLILILNPFSLIKDCQETQFRRKTSSGAPQCPQNIFSVLHFLISIAPPDCREILAKLIFSCQVTSVRRSSRPPVWATSCLVSACQSQYHVNRAFLDWKSTKIGAQQPFMYYKDRSKSIPGVDLIVSAVNTALPTIVSPAQYTTPPSHR